MKRVLLLATSVASCLAFSACNHTIDGTLTVNDGQTVQLNDKKGNLVSLETGGTTIVMGKNKLQLKINGDTVELDASTLPQFDSVGTHVFNAADTGQPVTISESALTIDNATPPQEGVRYCQFPIVENIPCPPPAMEPPPGPGPAPGGPGGPGHPGDGRPGDGGRPGAGPGPAPRPLPPPVACGPRTRYVDGHQTYVYQVQSQSFKIDLQMMKPDSTTVVAEFKGLAYDQEPETLSAGECFPNRLY